MRILEMKCRPVGPLLKPVCFRWGKNCTVVFDDNEAGKTALVDIIVNMLFRRGSAQSRFCSRRFTEYDGYVRLEHRGEEMTCEGNADLDRLLGLPAEFSRLPIVRGSDLALLWSGNREKKGPLLDACIRHFSADLEENPAGLVSEMRARAGLPPKRNCWTKGKSEELRNPLELCRKKDLFLSALSAREKASRERQAAAGKLQSVREELASLRRERESLKEERLAALCAAAGELERKLQALKRRYGEEGYERCSRGDLQLWAELAAREEMLVEKEASLKEGVERAEAGIADLRVRIDNLTQRIREAEGASGAARERLEGLRRELERKGRRRADTLAEAGAHLHNARRAGEQRSRMRWLAALALIMAALAAGLIAAGQVIPGGCAAVAALGVGVGSAAVTAVCGRAVEEAEKKVRQLLRECGVQAAGSLEAAVSALERHFQEEEERGAELLKRADEDCRDREEELRKLAQERLLAERELENLTASLRETRSRLTECLGELDSARSALSGLMQKTGMPDRSSLEAALKEKERLEGEIGKIEARLMALFGEGEDWRERLLELAPYLERCPAPRPLEELEGLIADLEKRGAELAGEEQALQQQHDHLLQQEVENARSLYAIGCEDVSSLAQKLEEAALVLKGAIREALAALWVQQAIEAVKGEFADILLMPFTRAGEIFYRITGRYDTLTFTREGGDVVFSAAGEGVEFTEDSLSDGTRAQLLLSLRLALLERVLGEEQGFLVLDDPLLNSSAARKRNAIKVLLDYARQGWQILYLTVDGLTVDVFRELGGDLVEVKRVADFYQSG